MSAEFGRVHSGPNNPFATRWIRPGALAYRFPPGQSAEQLVETLRSQHWWGEILGEHGSGKSTLLATLVPALAAAQRRPFMVALHDGQRRLPAELGDWRSWTASTQVIVDGYEQLSGWSRWRLQRRCRRQESGLLVTAHAATGLPQLTLVKPDLSTALVLVDELLDGPLNERPSPIAQDDVTHLFDKHNGNIRDMLFDLYDLYERRRS